jgi:DNA processing protein
MHTDSEQALVDLLTLWRCPGIGPKNIESLLAHFGSVARILELARRNDKQAFLQVGLSNRTTNALCNHKITAEDDITWLQAASNHHIITLHDPRYPELLKRIDTAPPVLFLKGNPEFLSDPQIAIVGSRNPTQNGINLAFDFAKHLGQSGFCITSGLALGIDGKAHEGALEANAPTLAITATGLDRVYPARHRALAHQIVEHGAIVSEFPIGTEAKPAHFPRRNRIISGLSIGTLVVEAAIKSGSLLTAQHALEQSREVFAIPGSIHNPLARGCHHLIRQGAKLVENAEHILEEIASSLDFPQNAPDIHAPIANTLTPEVESNPAHKPCLIPPADAASVISSGSKHADPEYQQLLDVMEYEPIAVDQLILQTGLTAEKISSMLLMLELQGFITANGGGRYSRIQ